MVEAVHISLRGSHSYTLEWFSEAPKTEWTRVQLQFEGAGRGEVDRREPHFACSSSHAVTHTRGAFQLIVISFVDHASALSMKHFSGAHFVRPAAFT